MGDSQPSDGHEEPEDMGKIEDEPSSGKSQEFLPAAFEFHAEQQQKADKDRPAKGKLIKAPVHDMAEKQE